MPHGGQCPPYEFGSPPEKELKFYEAPMNPSSKTSHDPRLGFTLIEMLVVVSIITLLIAMLMPALAKTRQATHRAVCSTKLHHMSVATSGYILSNRNYFPPHRQPNMDLQQNWFNLLESFGNNKDVSRCPAIDGVQDDYGVKWSWAYNYHYIGYGYNGFFLGLYSHPDYTSYGYITQRAFTRLQSVKDPTKLIVVGDSSPKTIGGANHGVSLTLWWPYIHAAKEGVNSKRHGNAGVVTFADGHVEVVENPDAKIHPPYDGSPINIEYWDPFQRKP